MIPFTNKEYESYLNHLKINTLTIKNIVELEIIVIIQVNRQVLHKAYVIQNIVYLKKFLWIFTMNETMIVILSLKN